MIDTILHPLAVAVSAVMLVFHSGITALGVPEGSGWAWGGAIVGLVIVIRILLIPLFVKQIKSQRSLQLLQPEIKKIQAKYKGRKDPESRQAMSAETMALYKETGTNPLSSCLPILAQSPIFFALFHVLNSVARNNVDGAGLFTQADIDSASAASIFGAPISATFTQAGDFGSSSTTIRVVTAIMIVLMSSSQFFTQRQLIMKNMPASATDNPFAQQQKMLMYVFPVIFLVTGINFPIGVLVYWLTTNVWTLCQQLFVIRRMPTPGSLADKQLQARRHRHGRGPAPSDVAAPDAATPDAAQTSMSSGTVASPEAPGGAARQQPRRQQPRDKRKRPPGQQTPRSDDGRPQAG